MSISDENTLDESKSSALQVSVCVEAFRYVSTIIGLTQLLSEQLEKDGTINDRIALAALAHGATTAAKALDDLLEDCDVTYYVR